MFTTLPRAVLTRYEPGRMVVWDLKAIKPTKVLAVPGAPLEIRWSLNPNDNWAITATALTSKLWLVKQDAQGEWVAKDVATIGDPAAIPLPVDISITRDGKGLWVNTFMDGKTRYFDLSNPEAPKQTYEKVTGKQVNMLAVASEELDVADRFVSTILFIGQCSLESRSPECGTPSELFSRNSNSCGTEYARGGARERAAC